MWESDASPAFGDLLAGADVVKWGLMNIFVAILIYLLMAAILATGVVMAVKGAFWLLIVGLLGFIVAVTKVAILHH